MIAGCSGGLFGAADFPTLQLAPAEAIDNTATACPEIPASTRKVFDERVPRPAEWKKTGAKTKSMQAHIDRQDVLIERMGGTGKSVVSELDACRGKQPAAPKTS
jgi:hypothetical protein